MTFRLWRCFEILLIHFSVGCCLKKVKVVLFAKITLQNHDPVSLGLQLRDFVAVTMLEGKIPKERIFL